MPRQNISHNSLLAVRSDMVQLLVHSGADLNAQTTMGWTPVTVAAVDRDLKALRLFAKKKANFTIVDNLGAFSYSLLFLYVLRANSCSTNGCVRVEVVYRQPDQQISNFRMQVIALTSCLVSFAVCSIPSTFSLGLTPNDYYITGNEKEPPLYGVLPEAYLDENGNYLYKDRPPPERDNRPRRLNEIIRSKEEMRERMQGQQRAS